MQIQQIMSNKKKISNYLFGEWLLGSSQSFFPRHFIRGSIMLLSSLGGIPCSLRWGSHTGSCILNRGIGSLWCSEHVFSRVAVWCVLLAVHRCPLVCGCSGVAFAVMCMGSGPSMLGWLSPFYRFSAGFST